MCLSPSKITQTSLFLPTVKGILSSAAPYLSPLHPASTSGYNS
jgi:hypothetical protein